MRRTIAVVSGFFDPLGPQHLDLIDGASKIGDIVIVGVNSDACSRKKKGQDPFFPLDYRMRLISKVRDVYEARSFDDTDGTACQLIRNVIRDYPDDRIVFCNGGDRSPDQKPCPEENMTTCHEMMYGVGGDTKSGSSSDVLRKWVNDTMMKHGCDFRLKDKY